jgi:hypothetical protein
MRIAALTGAALLGVGGLALAGFAGAQSQPTAREMAYPKPTCDSGTQILDTKITKHPPRGKGGSTFGFKAFYCNSPQSGTPPKAKFACNIDGKGFDKCASPKTYGGLGKGKHKFKVKATKAKFIDSGDPTPAHFKWKIH